MVTGGGRLADVRTQRKRMLYVSWRNVLKIARLALVISPFRAEQNWARSSDDAANSFYQSSCSASSTNQGHNSMREGSRSRRGEWGGAGGNGNAPQATWARRRGVRVEQLLPHCARRRLNWGTNWAFAVRCFLSCFGCFQAKKYYPTMARKKN